METSCNTKYKFLQTISQKTIKNQFQQETLNLSCNAPFRSQRRAFRTHYCKCTMKYRIIQESSDIEIEQFYYATFNLVAL